MNSDLLLPLIVFALVSSATPGPNNLMVMASGANFGFRRSLPHMLGISIGFMLMLGLAGLGLAELLLRAPLAQLALKIGATLYMFWLALKIARAGAPQPGKHGAHPMGFIQAAAFQWINPKAWSMVLAALSLYAADQGPAAVLTIALVFGAVNLPTMSLWAVIGLQVRHLLGSPARLRLFNWSMAALLLASLWPVLASA